MLRSEQRYDTRTGRLDSMFSISLIGSGLGVRTASAAPPIADGNVAAHNLAAMGLLLDGGGRCSTGATREV